VYTHQTDGGGHRVPRQGESPQERLSRVRVTRRRIVKGAAVTAGAAVATGYVKPSLRSFGAPIAHAAGSSITQAPPLEPISCVCSVADLDLYSKAGVLGKLTVVDKNTLRANLKLKAVSGDGLDCLVVGLTKKIVGKPFGGGCPPIGAALDGTTITISPAIVPNSTTLNSGQEYTFDVTFSRPGTTGFNITNSGNDVKAGIQVFVKHKNLPNDDHGANACATGQV
jgi:hypothetical protein